MPPRERFAFRAQHYIFAVLVFRFGIFEWLGRTGRLRSALSAFVFPLLSAVGAGLLLAQSRKPQDGVPRGDHPPSTGRARMLHGM
jgi:hypothetical protein